MANKIDNIDVGIITAIEKTTTVTTVRNSASQMFTANMDNETQEWRIEGWIIDVTHGIYEQLENTKRHGQLVLIDCADSDTELIGYGKVTSLRLMGEEGEAGILSYEAIISMVSVLGNTRVQTADCYLVDLLYRARYKSIFPALGYFNKSWSSNRLEFTWTFYVANYKNQAQSAVFESEVADDLSYIDLYEYDGAIYQSIGRWGTGGNAWGSSSGGYTVDFGVRGATKAIGTIGRSLGTAYRIIVQTESLSDGSGIHYYNAYTAYQRLLKITLVHVSRDAQRPNPQISWVDGSFGYGVP